MEHTKLEMAAQDPIVSIEPFAVKRSTAARLLDCGPTLIWKYQKSGVLETVRIGADTRITVRSIKALVEKNKVAA